LSAAFKKDLYKIPYNIYQGAGIVAFGHIKFFDRTEDSIFLKEFRTGFILGWEWTFV
jgi:hypothetical protein